MMPDFRQVIAALAIIGCLYGFILMACVLAPYAETM